MKTNHLLVLVLATLLTFSFVWVRLEIVKISFDINRYAKTEQELRDDCNTLSLKINEVKSPQNLERLAVTKFQMQPAKSNQLIVIHK